MLAMRDNFGSQSTKDKVQSMFLLIHIINLIIQYKAMIKVWIMLMNALELEMDPKNPYFG